MDQTPRSAGWGSPASSPRRSGWASPVSSQAQNSSNRSYYDSYVLPKEEQSSKSRFDSESVKAKSRRRLMIWGGIAAMAVILIALAVGLGVGLSQKKGSESGSEPEAVSSDDVAPSTTTAATSTTSSSTTSSRNPSIPTSLALTPSCPTYNGTIYTTNRKSFKIECGIDYSALGNIQTLDATSLRECLDACATTDGCIDATFLGAACYLKDQILEPNYSNRGVAGGRLEE